MRIGVDGGCWTNARGYGRYARELLSAMVEMAPEDCFVFFFDGETVRRFDLARPNVDTVVADLDRAPGGAAVADGRRSVPDVLRLTRDVARSDVDVLFFPSVYTFFPVPPGVRAVVGIHDVIADRFPELTLPTWRARLFWRMKVGLAVRQACTILTVSEYSAREIGRHFGLPADRIRVAGEAPAEVFRPSPEDSVRETAARYGLPDDARWFLYVGGFNPHKRVDVLVRAHGRLAAEGPGAVPHLLLVGAIEGDRFHRYDEQLRSEVEEAGAGERVIWTGFVPDEELRHLYSGATAVVLPSQAEGFGLPAVEAAACGAPVIATRESPLPEILEGGGLFVEPGDEDALTDALRTLAADAGMRARLGAAGRERAERLTWREGARAALDVLHEAAA